MNKKISKQQKKSSKNSEKNKLLIWNVLDKLHLIQSSKKHLDIEQLIMPVHVGYRQRTCSFIWI
jgi:hypothetical protein